MDQLSTDFDIQRSRIAYPTISESPYAVMDHRFCCIGNGYEWTTDKATGEQYLVTIDELGDPKGKQSERYQKSRYGAAERYLLTGTAPEWSLEPKNSSDGSFRRQDVVKMVDGRVTWDHINKPEHWYPMCDYSVIAELAYVKGHDLMNCKVTNPRRDIVEGALAVCELIIELGPFKPNYPEYIPEVSFDHWHRNITNVSNALEWRSRILERFYSSKVNHRNKTPRGCFLVSVNESDYKTRNPLLSALKRAVKPHGTRYKIALKGDQIILNPVASMYGKEIIGYLHPDLVEQIAARRQVTWLLVFRDPEDPQIGASTDAAMIPYLSDLVVSETNTYAKQRAWDELAGRSRRGVKSRKTLDWAKRWGKMTLEEANADAKALRAQYLFSRIELDKDGNEFVPEDSAKTVELYVPDPETILKEAARLAARTPEERKAENAAARARSKAWLAEWKTMLKAID